ncbi:MAG: putative zinc-binding metallopeptidase [Bacteroidales bacterium]|nr:putative zinc-binding metallopeptidase [Bacteroidales bacterium]MCM1146292.1 putative zinc-binding metallopeptidase [Bacteroidales bacterium]MCM1205270.1 putative zinc-binding metallopeptidase [Bacillota bacterium]MCM1509643.1 putative zinc-binding metallopeptidase [Clostridium sp.]
MKIKYFGFMLLFAASGALTSCSEDDLDPNSIFSTVDGNDEAKSPEYAEFDEWIMRNYTEPYNIRLQYLYNDKETDLLYNVIPADFDKSKGLAKLVKHMWVDAYAEAVSEEFIKTYTPRTIQLIGSYEWNSNGSQVLGTAEGGLKVMLYGVNFLDLDNPRVNTSDPYANKGAIPLDLNHWFFHTMHHEFCHILTQKKDYPTDFRAISAGRYHSTDWINVKDIDSAKEGFVTGYASGEYNEDFAEVYSTYITMSQEGWDKILDNAGAEGAAIIKNKLSIIREYFYQSWDIDIDKLRTIVLRRSAEAEHLDLHSLN